MLIIALYSNFGMFMESGILRVSCKINVKPESLTLQETRSFHDFMNIPKIEFIS